MRKIHISYVEVPTERWLGASGGRCYREASTRANFNDRWFNSETAYRQHYRTGHLGPIF